MQPSKDLIKHLESLTLVFEDFPDKGVSFKDLSQIYEDVSAMRQIGEYFYENLKPLNPDCVIGCDARGFIIGTLISQVMQIPFVMARKPDKLPGDLVKQEYELEYGKSELQMQRHIITKYKNAVIADDVLATAGTCCAVYKMLKKEKINLCAYAFISQVTFFNGKDRITKETGNENIFCLLNS